MERNNITSYFIEQDSTLAILQEPYNDEYTCFNTGGVEIEVGEFLYGFIRMIKPELVLETGTNFGISAMYIAQALKDNGRGKLLSLERLLICKEIAQNRMKILGLEDYVELILIDSRDYKTERVYDFVFLDTEPCYRFQEFLTVFPNISAGGFVAIHDLHPHMQQLNVPPGPFGIIPETLKFLILNHTLQVFHFKTPRGLTFFQKISSEHYSNALLLSVSHPWG